MMKKDLKYLREISEITKNSLYRVIRSLRAKREHMQIYLSLAFITPFSL